MYDELTPFFFPPGVPSHTSEPLKRKRKRKTKKHPHTQNGDETQERPAGRVCSTMLAHDARQTRHLTTTMGMPPNHTKKGTHKKACGSLTSQEPEIKQEEDAAGNERRERQHNTDSVEAV